MTTREPDLIASAFAFHIQDPGAERVRCGFTPEALHRLVFVAGDRVKPGGPVCDDCVRGNFQPAAADLAAAALEKAVTEQ